MLNPTDFRNIVSGKRQDVVARVLRQCLRVVEVPYRSAVRYRNHRFDTQESLTTRVNVPVISVGNLTMGGTGKTPFVCWLSNWFQEQGIRVAIVSRGYGSNHGQKNDEAVELQQRIPNVPHLQNPNRVEAARKAIQNHEAQVIILDDGFQHRRIARDLNVVLVDATDPFGCDHVFPRGLLREPLEGIGRAEVVCLTRCDIVNENEIDKIENRYRILNPNALFLRLEHKPARWIDANGNQRTLESMCNRRVAALCAIGNPDAFRATLESCGCQIELFETFPDHHPFRDNDICRFQNLLADVEVDFVACSHKDLVKINRKKIGDKNLLALQIEMSFLSGDEEFTAKLTEILQLINLRC